MRSRFVGLVVALSLAGCAVEHGNPPQERQGGAGGGGGAAHSPPPPPHGAPRDSQPGVMHRVFDRRLETVAPGVVRLTVRVVVRMQAGREAARATMEAIAAEARRQDSTLAAIRVLGYEVPRSHADSGGMGFVPLAYLEWVPPGGWDSLTARNARSPHRTDVVFVQDLAAHPGARRGGGR